MALWSNSAPGDGAPSPKVRRARDQVARNAPSTADTESSIAATRDGHRHRFRRHRHPRPFHTDCARRQAQPHRHRHRRLANRPSDGAGARRRQCALFANLGALSVAPAFPPSLPSFRRKWGSWLAPFTLTVRSIRFTSLSIYPAAPLNMPPSLALFCQCKARTLEGDSTPPKTVG